MKDIFTTIIDGMFFLYLLESIKPRDYVSCIRINMECVNKISSFCMKLQNMQNIMIWMKTLQW